LRLDQELLGSQPPGAASAFSFQANYFSPSQFLLAEERRRSYRSLSLELRKPCKNDGLLKDEGMD
jgi:hypothetical protein